MTSRKDTWWDRAACKDADHSIFCRDHNVSEAREAKAICGRCPVQKECLKETLLMESGNSTDSSVIFGNTTPRERNAMIKRVGGDVCALIEALDREIKKGKVG